jgi:co-chaperonin GroES (HSP10)
LTTTDFTKQLKGYDTEADHEMTRMLRKVRVPRGRRLYVRIYSMDLVEKTSEGGIILPQTSYEREIESGVRAVVLKTAKACDPELAPGTWVLIPRFCGTRLDINSKYVLIFEESVMCVLDPEETVREILGSKVNPGKSVSDIVGTAPAAY